MKAIYLTGENVYLRAFTIDDKDHAAAWADGPWPINSVRGEEILKDWHKSFWPDRRNYAICSQASEEVLGKCGVEIYQRTADVSLNTAPWIEQGDEIKAEVMAIIVPWLSMEWDMMNVTVAVPGDHPAMKSQADELGMECLGTFRQFFARPGGKRVDCHFYQKLNGMIEVPGA